MKSLKPSSAILWAVCLGYSMVILDTSVLNVALPSIGAETHASSAQQRWIIDAYVLVMTSLLLVGGGLIDRFGAKRVFNTGIVLFALASLASALSGQASLIIAARTIQGVGGALLIPATLAIIMTYFTDLQARGRAIAIVATATASPQAFGPTLGGIMVQTLGWRSIFLLNIPIAIVALMLARSVPGSTGHRRSLDIPGVVLIALALGGLTYAIIDFSNAWTMTPAVLCALGVTIVAFVAFLFVEQRAKNPLLPSAVRRSPSVNLSVLAGTFLFILFYGALFGANLYSQDVLKLDALTSGLILLPGGLPVFLLPLFISKIAEQHGISPFALTVTGTVIASGGAAIALLTQAIDSPYLIAGSLLVVGIGFGIASPPHLTLVTLTAPQGTAGVISALGNAGRQAGYLLGVAAVGMAGTSLAGFTTSTLITVIAGLVTLALLAGMRASRTPSGAAA